MSLKLVVLTFFSVFETIWSAYISYPVSNLINEPQGISHVSPQVISQETYPGTLGPGDPADHKPKVIIFDPVTYETLNPPFVEYYPLPNRRPKGNSRKISTKDGEEPENGGSEDQNQRGPCFCRNETVGRMCGCCFGMRIDRFNFSRESKLNNYLNTRWRSFLLKF